MTNDYSRKYFNSLTSTGDHTKLIATMKTSELVTRNDNKNLCNGKNSFKIKTTKNYHFNEKMITFKTGWLKTQAT